MTNQNLTLAQLYTEVGSNLMGSDFVSSSPTLAGTTDTIIDESLFDIEIGSWVLGTSGTIAGDLVRVALYERTGYTMSLRPSLSAASATGHTYEIYSPKYSPTAIKRAINRAIYEATNLIFPKETSLTLHADSRRARFDLPTEFAMVNKVEFRSKVQGITIHTCGAVFDESVDSDFTVTLDTKKYWLGGGSNKFVIAGTASNGNLVSDAIPSKDLSGMTHLEFWVWTESATAADDLRIILSSTTNGSTETEALAVPATTARTDHFFRVALANPEDDTAIISVALEYNANVKANTVFLDDIKAVDDNSAVYTLMPRRFYSVDHENNDLVLDSVGVVAAGYNLLKITGGSIPTALSATTDVCDIPEEFVIARATALMLMGGSRGRDGDTEDRRGLAAYWDGRANQERNKFPPIINKVLV